MKWLLIPLLVIITLTRTDRSNAVVERKERLSEYGFFSGDIANLNPADGIIPYNVNTPLFSNYAEKLRFVKIPAGKSAVFSDSNAFEFPVGTILIKNFFYPEDLRKPEGARKIIETRLLVHQPDGWEAWPYVWNEAQNDAEYDPAGEIRTVSFVGNNGKKQIVTHAIPNKNQCKGCHASNGKMVPIGLTARQLNGTFEYNHGQSNQLTYWSTLKILSGMPPLEHVPALAVWNDPATGTLDSRARAYLDANCGHCHSRTGPANTSGLFLDFYERRPTQLGVNKTPVAAGRGAGNLKYDIVPGKPDQSILLYRMKTNDPAVAMPELGREEIHKEGVALIEEWIRKNPF